MVQESLPCIFKYWTQLTKHWMFLFRAKIALSLLISGQGAIYTLFPFCFQKIASLLQQTGLELAQAQPTSLEARTKRKGVINTQIGVHIWDAYCIVTFRFKFSMFCCFTAFTRFLFCSYLFSFLYPVTQRHASWQSKDCIFPSATLFQPRNVLNTHARHNGTNTRSSVCLSTRVASLHSKC